MRPEDFFEEGKLYRFTQQWKRIEEHMDQIFRDPYLRVVYVDIDSVVMFLHLYERIPPASDAHQMYVWFLIGERILGCMLYPTHTADKMFERATK